MRVSSSSLRLRQPLPGLALVLLLCLGCKAKMDGSQIDDERPDLSMPITGEGCEGMKCLFENAVCCSGEPCIDTGTDPRHCGACGTACSSQESCIGGRCVCKGGGNDRACSGGTYCCPDRVNYTGGCKALMSDNANCGSCGYACKPTESCSAGRCTCGGGAVCSGAQSCCGSACADLGSDPQNCGKCGHRCAEGKKCIRGACEGECVGGCPMGQTCCAGTCVNLLNDNMHCGACGRKCPEIFMIPLPCIIGICAFEGQDGGMSMDM